MLPVIRLLSVFLQRPGYYATEEGPRQLARPVLGKIPIHSSIDVNMYTKPAWRLSPGRSIFHLLIRPPSLPYLTYSYFPLGPRARAISPPAHPPTAPQTTPRKIPPRPTPPSTPPSPAPYPTSTSPPQPRPAASTSATSCPRTAGPHPHRGPTAPPRSPPAGAARTATTSVAPLLATATTRPWPSAAGAGPGLTPGRT